MTSVKKIVIVPLPFVSQRKGDFGSMLTLFRISSKDKAILRCYLASRNNLMCSHCCLPSVSHGNFKICSMVFDWEVWHRQTNSWRCLSEHGGALSKVDVEVDMFRNVLSVPKYGKSIGWPSINFKSAKQGKNASPFVDRMETRHPKTKLLVSMATDRSPKEQREVKV